MRARLKQLLHEYIRENNPDVLVLLESETKLSTYLELKVDGVSSLIEELKSKQRPNYIIEEQCLEELTHDLRPSKYLFLKNLLEEEFESDYKRLTDAGVLTYEIINLIDSCQPVFEILPITETTDDDNHLRYAIAGVIAEYLEMQTV